MGPDFLVHASHLFDGMDDRQVAAALAPAEEVTQRESIQYVAMLIRMSWTRRYDAATNPGAGS